MSGPENPDDSTEVPAPPTERVLFSSTKKATTRARRAAFTQPATPSTSKTGADAEQSASNTTQPGSHAEAGYERMVETTHSELNALGELIDRRAKAQTAIKPFQSSLLSKMRSLKDNRSLRARASRYVLTIGDINLTDWELCTRLNLRAHTIPQLVDDMCKNGSMKTAVASLNLGLKTKDGLELMRCFDTAAEEIICSQRMSDFTYIKSFIHIVTRNLTDVAANSVLNLTLDSQRALLADQFLEQYLRLDDDNDLEYFLDNAHLRPREGSLLTGADYVDEPGTKRLMRLDHSWDNLLMGLMSCLVGDTRHVLEISTVRKAYLGKYVDAADLADHPLYQKTIDGFPQDISLWDIAEQEALTQFSDAMSMLGRVSELQAYLCSSDSAPRIENAMIFWSPKFKAKLNDQLDRDDLEVMDCNWDELQVYKTRAQTQLDRERRRKVQKAAQESIKPKDNAKAEALKRLTMIVRRAYLLPHPGRRLKPSCLEQSNAGFAKDSMLHRIATNYLLSFAGNSKVATAPLATNVPSDMLWTRSLDPRECASLRTFLQKLKLQANRRPISDPLPRTVSRYLATPLHMATARRVITVIFHMRLQRRLVENPTLF